LGLWRMEMAGSLRGEFLGGSEQTNSQIYRIWDEIKMNPPNLAPFAGI
jgi:hypothetical protein